MKEGIFLSKQDQFKYRQIVEFQAGRVSRREIARLLQLSERSVTRLSEKVNRLGFKGAVHGNRGQSPTNKCTLRLKKKIMKLVESRYYDFNMLHSLEVLKKKHQLSVNRETFRRWCHEKQLVKRKKRRRSHPRFYRSRMPSEGYLLQMDGSPHEYNGRDVWSLVLAIDDATSEIPYAQFFAYETTDACMKVLREIILKKGVPRALYVDKAGWAGGGKRVEFTQFHRACNELGIQVIYANSPEAKGRVERAFNTIQDRIIPELRVAKIKSMERANWYLKNRFLPKYWNEKNVVAAAQSTTEYRALKNPKLLEEVLCFKLKRAVSNNNCVSIKGDIYQLRHSKGVSLAKKRVELRYYSDRPMGIFFEGQKLKHKVVSRYEKPQQTYDEYIEKLEASLGT